MTIDERLEALTRNLELLSLESEKLTDSLTARQSWSPRLLKAQPGCFGLWRCPNTASIVLMTGSTSWSN
jgi:hypothetical protein